MRRRPATRPHRDDMGASAVEYAMTVALLAVVIIGSVILFSGATTGLFTQACASLPYKSSAC